MTKRTKRYGGFLIGDRVKTKHDYNVGNGEVVGMRDGYLLVKFIVLGNGVVDFAFMPNQLINLTRIKEKQQEYSDKLDKKINELFSPEDGKKLFKVLNQDEIMKDLEHEAHDMMPPNAPYPISPENMFKSYKDIEDKIKKIGDEIYSSKLELDRIKVRDCIQHTELDINRIVDCDPLPSPYTRDVYTSSKDF